VSAATGKQKRQADHQRKAAIKKANARRAEIKGLKTDLRSGRLRLGEALGDGRAGDLTLLKLMTMVPRCTERIALEVLLECRINGAETCGNVDVDDQERVVSRFNAALSTTWGRSLSAEISKTRKSVPLVEQRPSEFSAARRGLEVDPLLLLMIDRLVGALRLYVKDDDGGLEAHRVLEQWIRFRVYRDRVAKGELPPPSIKTMPEVE
jgi:hypothetical protein